MTSLFEPLKLEHLTLKNRIVFPPMANDLASEGGEVSEASITHYKRRALGVGLVIVEHSYVSRDGKLSSKQLGIWDDSLLDGLTSLVKSVHASGAPVCIQINHAGRKTRSAICGNRPIGPSAIAAGESYETPRELEEHEIRKVAEAFGEAAKRACKAGFDAVEIHGAHGFLLNQFASPLSNKRNDEYGGSFENRIRFPLNVVEEVRRTVGPDLPLLYRLGAYDGEGGITIPDCQTFAQRLIELGINIVDVSGGLVGSKPENAPSPGSFIPLAEEIKKAVKAPVIGVGGITDPNYADRVIREGKVDLVAVGRAMLADPDWALNAARVLGHN